MAQEAEWWRGQPCFIVGPIGDALDLRGMPGRARYEEALEMWEKVFEPACEALGLCAIRSDKIIETGEIPEQIFLYLRDAPVVIADVTGGNANVMYELGLRHTRPLVTVQVGEHERLPFDIASIRTIQFRRTEGGLVELREALIESLRAALEGRGRPVTATRVWNEPSVIDPEGIAAAVKLSMAPDETEPVDEPGFVDVLAEGEAAVEAMSEHITNVGSLTERVGALMQDAQARIGESDAHRGGFAGRLRVARDLATELADPAESMDAAAVSFDDSVAKVDAMMQYIIARSSEGEEDAAVAQDFFGNVLTMVESTRGAEDSVRGILSGVIGLRRIARDLAPVSKTMERAYNRVLKGIGTILGWESPIRSLLVVVPTDETAGGAAGDPS